jgi:hypothetical protein
MQLSLIIYYIDISIPNETIADGIVLRDCDDFEFESPTFTEISIKLVGELKDKTLTISNDIYPPDENPVII